MGHTLRILLRVVPIAIVMTVVLAWSTPARAETTCVRDLTSCYQRAAGMGDWWSMWAYGLDCELGFVDCTRRAIIGR